MKHFSRAIALVLMTLACVIAAVNAQADAFSQVPAGSVFYSQLAILQNATWENDISSKAPRLSKSTELTRYEFAIEIAKSAIDFSAHEQANPAWITTVPRVELRSLRALAQEFSVELAGFNVDTKYISQSIDRELRRPETAPMTKQPNNLRIQAEGDRSLPLGSFPLTSSLSLADSQPPPINIPLSKQFEIYTQLTTPPNAMLRMATPSIIKSETSDVEAQANTALNAGANLSVNDWLSLRAGYAFNQNNQPQTLQQTLLASNNNSWFPSLGETNAFGGGLDVKVSPGLTLSGGISRLSQESTDGQNQFSGTQLEGGLGVSGLNNRLLLSARLARLMPDDATSLASTAARLNLDFELSNSLSLNLLYQQMFSLSPQQDNKSTFAGGVNIHF